MEELKILFYPSLIPEGHLLWLSSAYTCRVLCAGWLDKHIWHCTILTQETQQVDIVASEGGIHYFIVVSQTDS